MLRDFIQYLQRNKTHSERDPIEAITDNEIAAAMINKRMLGKLRFNLGQDYFALPHMQTLSNLSHEKFLSETKITAFLFPCRGCDKFPHVNFCTVTRMDSSAMTSRYVCVCVCVCVKVCVCEGVCV